MKQTFYLHEYSDGGVLLSRKPAPGAKELIGTIELDVQPIRKEVEKVIDANCIEDSTLYYQKVIQRIPLNAYNVKIHYTVKE